MISVVEDLKNASQTRNNRRNSGAAPGKNLTSVGSSTAEQSLGMETAPPPLSTVLTHPGGCTECPGATALLCAHMSYGSAVFKGSTLFGTFIQEYMGLSLVYCLFTES